MQSLKVGVEVSVISLLSEHSMQVHKYRSAQIYQAIQSFPCLKTAVLAETICKFVELDAVRDVANH